MRLCVPSKSGISVFPSPVEFLQSRPVGLQSWMLLGLLLLTPDPQAGEPYVGLRVLSPVGEPLWYNYFPVCGSSTQLVWDLIVLQMHPSYCLVVASLSLDVGYLFFGRFHSFLSMVVQRLVVILVFSWELSSSPFTPPSCLQPRGGEMRQWERPVGTDLEFLLWLPSIPAIKLQRKPIFLFFISLIC